MDIEKKIHRLEELQKEYEIALKEFEKLSEWTEKIQKLNSKMNKIGEYYYSDWLNDMSEVQEKKPEFYVDVMGEDAVFEMLSEHYIWCKKMIYIFSKQIFNEE